MQASYSIQYRLSPLRLALQALRTEFGFLSYDDNPHLPDPQFLIVHTNTEGAVSRAFALAKAAGLTFNPGVWMRPCSMPVPTRLDDLQPWAELLREAGINAHLSQVDLANY